MKQFWIYYQLRSFAIKRPNCKYSSTIHTTLAELCTVFFVAMHLFHRRGVTAPFKRGIEGERGKKELALIYGLRSPSSFDRTLITGEIVIKVEIF